MTDPVRILTTEPDWETTPPLTATTPALPTLVAVIESTFVMKSDFAEGAIIEECYVIDGGNSQTQPCNE